ncbi:TPA: TIGR03758 family integrating conjugative element protein [Pseudomonas aeruginosa]|uniref:TIGR03758 family integrating conjugative element protein n=1 Tax=Pseudomonas aeruginosa TaxID=287 RepID=UPI00070CF3C3|nr:TIGR03758 family integrating conjugative element protein [Pseudomonas aeruginosa]EKV3033174.1 TIGR03758 family integrating conjugative element protein [Pseudomonas aeruginosa]EKV3075354.1 TIGR03758 family integrating conjugative element protein [Pseudomonas aeruginosa]MCO3843615.1 TIGR03758 family integrating conjugative element protein [Pseudomonas aeruginosa]MCT4978728.1 TIGR03758 family integrating conjugative element protein [Pseudomonas aeruginosa]NPW39411.1 TIGR03758 family integratin
MTAAQLAAFKANGDIAPGDLSTLLLGLLFAVLLLWGAWAMRTAYVGWAEQRVNHRQFFSVVVRFAALYLALAFLFLS